jgi:hypothetical protein
MNEPFLKTRTRGFLLNYVGIRIICNAMTGNRKNLQELAGAWGTPFATGQFGFAVLFCFLVDARF